MDDAPTTAHRAPTAPIDGDGSRTAAAAVAAGAPPPATIAGRRTMSANWGAGGRPLADQGTRAAVGRATGGGAR